MPPQSQDNSAILSALQSIALAIQGSSRFDQTWTTWDPTLTGITRGTGYTQTAKYFAVGKMIQFYYLLQFGVGGAITIVDPTITFPVEAVSGLPRFFPIGQGGFNEAGYTGGAVWNATPSYYDANKFTINTLDSAAAYARVGGVNATIPFSWSQNDIMFLTGFYPAA
jgi:hypothetical protein